jgi:hypothetical protein
VYTVLMPPLSFDANSPAPPPDPSPETILLVREVRVSPSVVFRGHVNPAPVQVPAAALPSVAPSTPAGEPPAQPEVGILTRMRNFFRRITGRVPCADVGCGG